jgi:amino acid adenylation domain-containing protein
VEAARRGAGGEGVAAAPAVRRAERGGGPLAVSYAQERLWFLDQLLPNTPTYNIPGGVDLTGALQVGALEQSVAELVRRHEVLRTCFVEVDGRPAQQIAADIELDFPVVDLRGLPEVERLEQARRIALAEARRPFDLRVAPLLRVRLVRLEEDRQQFLFTMHHIISDGWSMNVAVGELIRLHQAMSCGEPSPLAELELQYADYAAWQRQRPEADVPGQVAYWKRQLADAPTLELPTDRPRGAERRRGGARYPLTLPTPLSADLVALCRRESVTVFMALLSAYQLVLSRYSGNCDISVGAPLAGRDRLEIEGLIGFFVNTLVMRTRLDPGWSVRELLRQVRETSLQAYAHREVQFERLVEELQPERHLDRSPLFQVMLMVQPARPSVEWPGLQPRAMAVDSGTSKFDLMLSLVHDQQQVSGAFEYNADLFDQTTIARLAQCFEGALRAMVSDVEQPLRSLQLMTGEQRRQLLTEWNDTETDFGGPRCLAQMLEAQAAHSPDAVALVYEGRQITFDELDRRANKLARHLRALGVGPEATVGLLLERGVEAVVGVWGILKAGGAYVPLDAGSPASRVAAVLADARPALLLTESRLFKEVSGPRPPVVLLDTDREAIASRSGDRLEARTTPANLAYVIYTSGTSGQPKGVAVQHASLFNLAGALKKSVYSALGTSLRVGLNATLTFDASVKQWLQLLDGHTLDVLPDAVRWDADEFLAHARSHELEVIDCTPPQLRTLLEVELLNRPGNSLKAVLVGGDALDDSTWGRLAASTTVAFYNVYGPTECTVDTTVTRVRAARPTIGRPLPNVRAYLLDQFAAPAPLGVPGEICVGGAGVARGYLHQPELTARRFVPDAFGSEAGARLYRTGDLGRHLQGGEIEFRGRLDSQVKIRGYRIELGEIEAALGQHPSVRQCSVLAQDAGQGERRLVAYLVPGGQPPPSPNELRGYLKERLPEYMVPAAYVTLDSIPLTASGKVNWRALPRPEQGRAQSVEPFAPPRTPTEQQLAAMWTELLGLERVSIHDNFFELGGHSLLLTQLASRVRQAMNVDVPLRSLFEAPTIQEMGRLLSQWQMQQHDPAELARLLEEVKTLTPDEIRAHLMLEELNYEGLRLT